MNTESKLREARRAVLAQEEGQVPKHIDKQDDHDPAVTVESFLIQHPRRSGTVEVVTAADHEGAVFAARLRERERLRGYFLDALADKGIVWPGEVDILYDKCFAAPTPDHSPGNMAQPIHAPAVTTPREVLVGESPVDRIVAPAQEQPKSDAQIILDIITLFERRPEFKAAFREEWLRYTGVEQQQAGAVVSDEIPGAVVSAYRVGDGLNAVTIQRVQQMEGHDLWAVKQNGNCLNSAGEWEWEPMPSSRDEDFLARCRFASADEARAVLALSQGGGK